MTDTFHLGLPVIEAAQAQKHVTYNEALAVLDALVMLAAIDRDLSAPPPSPAEGDRYLVKEPGSGAFVGKGNHIAHYLDGAWSFHAPAAGWTCYVEDEATLIAWDGESWQTIASEGGGVITELQGLALLGIGTNADTTNPFAAKLNNALWTAKTAAEGGDGNLRYKLSKESAAKTLSFLFQDNYAGRAEIGLAGDDDFHFKVSADGSAWTDALIIDRMSGAAKINAGLFLTADITPAQIAADLNDYNPDGLAGASVLRLSSDSSRNITGLSGGGDGRVVALINVGANNLVLKDASTSSSAGNRFAFGADLTLAPKHSAVLWYDATDSRWKLIACTPSGAGGRQVLAGNRTYYVRTDGSDANDGLSNTSGGAFLTIQKAYDTVAVTLDLAGYTVTIQVADGTYTNILSMTKPWVGGGTIIVSGNTSTPTNVIWNVTGNHCVSNTTTLIGTFSIQGFQLKTTTSGSCISNSGVGTLLFNAIDFGAVPTGAYHLYASSKGATIQASGNYTISGGGSAHMCALYGRVIVTGRTVTFSGVPTFSKGFLYATRQGFILANGNTYAAGQAASVTISNASPGVITWTSHPMIANDPVLFTTTGSLPTGLTANTVYYVKTILDANTFTVSATPGGAAINTSSAGSGTHTAHRWMSGARYAVDNLSMVYTNGGGASYFPGDAAGTTDAATYAVYN